MSWDRVERLIGAQNLEHLAQSRIAVVGLGSGGSFVALSLAMSGVGRFILVDDDTLESTNLVRHVADSAYLGQAKADAVADLIRRRNPHAEVEIRIGRIEEHLDALDSIDLLVVGVDGEVSKYIMNEACLQRNLTAVYAGVYERGEGGDVVVIRPYQGPCYACWAAELREGLVTPAPGANDELDYGMIGPQGTLEGEPALWLHVVRVAVTQADLALNELFARTDAYKTMPGNTIVLANNALEIIDGQVNPPHTAVWVTINRDPDCLVCGDLVRQRATLADTETEASLSLQDLLESTGPLLDEDDGEANRD